MTRGTYPSKIKEPYDIEQIRKMLESWADVPWERLPKDVKLIAWMYEGFEEAAWHNHHLAQEVRALEGFIDANRRRFEMWPDEVARDQARQAFKQAHKQMIVKIQSDERSAAHKAAKELNGNGHTPRQVAASGGSGHG